MAKRKSGEDTPTEPQNATRFPMKLSGVVGGVGNMPGNDDPNSTISRAEFLADFPASSGPERLAIYWGPGQPLMFVGDEYIEPQYMPASSQVMQIPFVIRYIWDDPEIDVDFDIWQGYSTSYIAKSVTTYYDFDLVNTMDDNVIPSHIHTGPTPWNGGLVGYYAEFIIIFGGGTNGYVCSGSNNFYVGAIKLNETGPLSWIDYVEPGSALAVAIYDAAEIEGAVPGDPCGDVGDCAPETVGVLGITEQQMGPCCVGVGPPVFLGTYSIDGIDYGNTIPLPYPLTIQKGYANPTTVDISSHATVWDSIGVEIQLEYAPNQYIEQFVPGTGNLIVRWPWVDTFKMAQGLQADYWSNLIPYEFEIFFGSRVLHIYVISAPVQMPSQTLLQAIQDVYSSFAAYQILVFIDTQYMIDCGLPLVPNGNPMEVFVASIESLCGQQSKYGWVYGGNVDYSNPENSYNIIKSQIDQFYALYNMNTDFTKPNDAFMQDDYLTDLPPTIIDYDGVTQTTVSGPPDGLILVPGSNTSGMGVDGTPQYAPDPPGSGGGGDDGP